jgi:hypothetical protein
LPPGRAHRDPARDDRALIAPGIAFPRLVGAVEFVSVSLDDHPLLKPDEVGPDHRLAIVEIDPSADLRRGESQAAAQGQECLLEFALRRRASDVVLLEQLLDFPGAGARAVASKLVLDRVEVEYFERLRLVEGSLERSTLDHLGEVQQRPRDGRAGDSVFDGDIGCGQGGRTVDVDAVVLAGRAARDGHIDLRPLRGSELVERSGVAVREDRPGPAGEDRGHPMAFASQERARDEGVDGVVDAVEAGAIGALTDT